MAARRLNPKVPRARERILDRCMAKLPADGFIKVNIFTTLAVHGGQAVARQVERVLNRHNLVAPTGRPDEQVEHKFYTTGQVGPLQSLTTVLSRQRVKFRVIPFDAPSDIAC